MRNVHARNKRQKELARAARRQLKFEKRQARRALKAERLGFGDLAGLTSAPQDAIGWEPARAIADAPAPLLDVDEQSSRT